MANKSKDKINQPPTGEGKKQSPELGAPKKLEKRPTCCRPNAIAWT